MVKNEKEKIQTEEELQTVSTALNSKTGGFAYSATAIIYVAGSLVFSLILTVIAASIQHSKGFEDLNEALAYLSGGKAYLYVSFLISPVIFALGVLTTLKMRKVKFKEVFPVKCHPKYYLIGLMLVFGLIMSLNQVNEWFLRLINKEEGEAYKQLSDFISNISGWDIPLAFIVLAILPAFFEELTFRGVILNSCEKNMGSIRTVFVVGFCFALFHGAPEQTIYQFIAGCLFAFVAVRSGSILPGIMMHFINNGIVVLFGACRLYDENGALAISNTANIILIVLGACCLAGGLLWLILDKKQKPLAKCQNGGVKSFFLYASVGIAILGIIWICSLFGVT